MHSKVYAGHSLKHPCTSVDRDMQINNYAAVLSKIERVFRMRGLTYCLLSNECKLYKIVFYGIIDICGKVFSSFVDDGVVINNRFYRLNTPPAKAGGFTVATKVAFRLKPVWPLLKQAEVIPPQFGRFHLHLPVARGIA